MSVTLTQPSIGNTNWGSNVNANWAQIQDAFAAARGVSGFKFDDQMANPTVEGILQRNAHKLLYNDGTAAQTIAFASDSITQFSGVLSVGSGGTGDTGTAWTTFTPTVTATVGTLGSVTASGRYKQLGKTYFVSYNIIITTNGTGAGALLVSLPNFALSAVYSGGIVGRESANTGKTCVGILLASSNNMLVFNYDNSYPASNGAQFYMGGIFEAM